MMSCASLAPVFRRPGLPWLALLLGAFLVLLPLAGYCDAAGQVKFVTGTVEGVSANGKHRPLARGSEINAGDTINTAKGASAQIRFTDGGFISLQPESLFRVDEYNYKNKTDGEEKGFFSLLKGGLRAVSGAIGHVNRKTYRVVTPVATIGIRGTGYNATLSDGLFVNVSEGAVSLTNNAGTLVVNAGSAAFVANMDTPPIPANEGLQNLPGFHSIPDAQLPAATPPAPASPNAPTAPPTTYTPNDRLR
jgi:hypothetical protein